MASIAAAPAGLFARRAAFNGLTVRPRAVARAVPAARLAPVAALKKDDEWETQKANPAFNMALAAMVAGSVFVSDVVAPEYAEAARSGGRMGGSSFRSAPRMAPRGGMGGQSRQAPPPGAMRGGMGMGMPMIMPMPMFSPFGFGFGFGGLSFIFNILIFLWVANFFMSFVSSLTSGNEQRRDDDDRF